VKDIDEEHLLMRLMGDKFNMDDQSMVITAGRYRQNRFWRHLRREHVKTSSNKKESG
jgi:hypothetical protein